MARGGETPIGGFGSAEDEAFARLLEQIDVASADPDPAISSAERAEMLQSAGAFGAELGDEYVGGEDAALAVDSETPDDAARSGAPLDDEGLPADQAYAVYDATIGEQVGPGRFRLIILGPAQEGGDQ